MTTTSTSTDLVKLGYLFAEIVWAGAQDSPTRLLVRGGEVYRHRD